MKNVDQIIKNWSKKNRKTRAKNKKFGLLKKTCLLLPSSFFGKDMKVDSCVSLFRESVV